MKLPPILCALFFLPLTAFADEAPAIETAELKHPVQPALWKIEGGELSTPSYLFGTIHLGDPRLTTLHPEAEKAFNSADRFYAEVDLDPAKMLGVSALMMRKDGKTLSSSIGPDLTKRLDAILGTINPAFSSQPFNPMKTWVMMTQLPLLELQLKGLTPLDAALFQRAQEADKAVTGLETIESQLKIFDDLTEKEQILLLEATLDQLDEDRKEGKSSTKEMVNLYLTGELTELGKVVRESIAMTTEENEQLKELGQRLAKQLLDDRNLTMADTISTALEKAPGDTHFFAVGVGHYIGEKAIQEFLVKKGYTITPLFK